jgi:hypothetical protein
MKGYLLKNEEIKIGDGCFIQSEAAEHALVVVFEDDKETGYFYAAEKDATGSLSILDMLFVYDAQQVSAQEKKAKLSILWSTDWQRCGLILNNTCHAVFDFQNKAGYNITGFPPPVLWNATERKLTSEMVKGFFS